MYNIDGDAPYRLLRTPMPLMASCMLSYVGARPVWAMPIIGTK